ncbi:MAG: hypothetical protein F6K57_37520 [Moorea sp. SIO4A5]|nr:hypothetical protein [Moorena sp. SIO4A5]
MQSLMGETPKTALHRYYPLPITLVQMFGKSDMLPFPTPYSLLPTPYSLLSPSLRIQSIPQSIPNIINTQHC